MEVTNPEELIKELKEGNERFIRGRGFTESPHPQAKAKPAGVIISCMDARVGPEVIFDQPLGRYFCLRVAGNMITEDIAASAALGCNAAGCRFILVVGHSDCAAVKTAISKAGGNEDPGFLFPISPVIENQRDKNQPPAVDDIARQHVLAACRTLEQSPHTRQLTEDGLVIRGGMYDVASGAFELL